ncbi:MAG: (d)CMP kinase [Bdellovibrionales bacterium]|nr:(d)CMP kinase [Bdellovibrionales bacterium]
MNRQVVTVDGLAGTGKTSISKLLAERLGFVHLSTGLLYRAVGLLALREKVDRTDEELVSFIVDDHSLQLVLDSNRSARVLVDGIDVFDDLYSPEVSESTSQVAQFGRVREKLVGAQREAFPGEDLVAEGRDMGSLIFPDAHFKFFVSTDEPVKVERRLKQLKEARGAMSEQEAKSLKEKMKIEIHERDKRDSEGGFATTFQQPDMYLVDNSTQPLEIVVENLYNVLLDHGIKPRMSGN